MTKTVTMVPFYAAEDESVVQFLVQRNDGQPLEPSDLIAAFKAYIKALQDTDHSTYN